MAYTKKVRFLELGNRFPVFYQEDPGVHLGGVYIRGGGMYDPPGVPGMAHFVEHQLMARSLIRNGNGRKRPKIMKWHDLELQFWEYGCGPGEYVDVATYRNKTTYLTDMLLRREFAETTFDMFAGMTSNPKIFEDRMRTEEAAVLNEWLWRDLDNPETEMDDVIHEMVYRTNPIRKRMCWDPGNIHRITHENVRSYVNDMNTTGNMGAIILGPNKDRAYAMADKYFGHLEEKSAPKLDYDGSDNYPKLGNVKSVEIEREGMNQYHVGLAFPTDPTADDSETLDVLGRVLQFRTEYVLRESNNVYGWGTYHPYVYIDSSPTHRMIYIWFNTPSESFVREGEARIFREIERIRNRGVDSTLAERATASQLKKMKHEFSLEHRAMRNSRKNWYYDSFRHSFGVLATTIAEAASNMPPENPEAVINAVNSYRDKVESVGVKKLVEATNAYLNPKEYVRVVIKPDKPTPYEVDPRQMELFTASSLGP